MKDVNGSYYYPNPDERSARVYVRQGENDIEFRLWHSDHPEVWDKHGWIAYSVLQPIAEKFAEQGDGSRNPLCLYDINLARAALKSEALHKKNSTPKG